MAKAKGAELPPLGPVVGDVQGARGLLAPFRRTGEQLQVLKLASEYNPKKDAEEEARRLVDYAIITAAYELDTKYGEKHGISILAGSDKDPHSEHGLITQINTIFDEQQAFLGQVKNNKTIRRQMWEAFNVVSKTPQQDVAIDLQSTPQQAIAEMVALDDQRIVDSTVPFQVRASSEKLHGLRTELKGLISNERMNAIRKGFVEASKQLQGAGENVNPLQLVADSMTKMTLGYSLDLDTKVQADRKEVFDAVKNGYMKAAGIVSGAALVVAASFPAIHSYLQTLDVPGILSSVGAGAIDVTGLGSNDLVTGVGAGIVLLTAVFGVMESAASGAANGMEEHKLRQKMQYMGQAAAQEVGKLTSDLKAEGILLPEPPRKKGFLPSLPFSRRNRN